VDEHAVEVAGAEDFKLVFYVADGAFGREVGLALAVLSVSASRALGTVLQVAHYAMLADLAALFGLARFIARRPIDTWTPVRPTQPIARV